MRICDLSFFLLQKNPLSKQGVLLQRGTQGIYLDVPLFKQGFNAKDLMYAAILGEVPTSFLKTKQKEPKICTEKSRCLLP